MKQQTIQADIDSRQITQRSGGATPLLILCFFLSGAVGLAYEVVWTRQLSLSLGVTIYAVSAVLAAFMAGLGSGAVVFGRMIDRGAAPARLYGMLEIGLGLYVLAFPIVLMGIEKASVALHPGVEGVTAGLIIIRVVLAIVALLIPTFLMGGTLPALIRYVADSRERDAGREHGGLAGALYAVNTFGALVGCLIAGFMMIETLGLSNTLRVGAVINIAIGLIAWLVAGEKTFWRSVEDQPKKAKKKSGTGSLDMIALMVYGTSGLCALALQVLWTRMLILTLNNTTYAFTLILATVLIGIAAGSAVISRMVSDDKESNSLMLASLQIGAGFMALLSLLALAANQPLLEMFNTLLPGGTWGDTFPGGRSMAAASLLTLVSVGPCSFLLGGCFPLVVALMDPNRRGLGGTVGIVYGVNVTGSVIGSLLGGFALIPLFGIQNGVIVISWLAALSGCLLLLTRTPKMRGPGLILALALIAPLSAAIMTQTNVASYLSAEKLDAGSDIQFYYEGSSATVLVSSQDSDLTVGREPITRIWINGDPIAGGFREALQLERLQAHIPLLMHKNPKNALVICFGTGSTAGAALAHGLDDVTAVDIAPEVFAAGPHFAKANLNVMESPKLRKVVEDGRNFLLTTRRQFDFITSEPPPPSNAGVVSLYTEEYYRLCRLRLKKGGIVSQWIPLHHLSERDFKSLVAAFTAVFPHAAMWYTKWDAIMIGGRDEIQIDIEHIAMAMKNERVAASLAGIGVTNPYQLIANFMMDAEQLKKYVAGVTPVTDDRPQVEFTAPRIHAQGITIKGPNLAGILALRQPPGQENFTEEEFSIVKTYFDSETMFLHGQVAASDGKFGDAAVAFERALKINPDNQDARYAFLSLNLRTIFKALAAGKLDMGLGMLADTVAMDSDNLFEAQYYFLRGMFYERMGKTDEAEQQLKTAVRKDETYYLAVVNLAGLYDTKLNNPIQARNYYARALKMKSSESERRSVFTAFRNLDARLKSATPGELEVE